eukprot:6495650-Alexandrium_andersonii.AAC.1
MSASLVGSEMCIRDRRSKTVTSEMERGRATEVGNEGVQQGLGARPKPNWARPRCRQCLPVVIVAILIV